jgi:hypothetical protein
MDGQALVPLSLPPRPYTSPEYKPLTAREQGFTLHAATRVAASNPRGLFRLCAYGARGAIASSRLSRLPSGTFAYELKRPLNDGRKTLVWTGEQLVRKLVPLIPPPFANLTRFHGVFAPRAKLREQVVAQVKVRTSSASAKRQATSPENESSILDVLPKRKRKTKKDKRYRLDWASLLSRIFAIDVMTCAQCKGKLRIVAKVDNPDAVAAMLRHLGLDQDPNPDPTTVAYECSPQLELAFDFGA